MEEALYSLLSGDPGVAAICGDRISPIEREEGSALPALTYFRVSGGRGHVHDGMTGLVESRFQIDVWGANAGPSGYGQAKELIRAVVALLGGYRGTVGATEVRGIFIDSERDFRADTAGDVQRLARVSLDIRVWHTE